MCSFAQPGFLLLALVVPPLVWWWLRQPRRRALRFPATATLAALPAGRGPVARWGGAALRALGLLALVLALAGPRWPDLRTRLRTEGIAIVLLVDVSGSMAERDYDWQGETLTRLDALKRVVGLFVAGGEGPDGRHSEGRAGDLLGVVPFAARPESLCPLTLSHSVLLKLLEGEQPRSLPTESETNVGDAIAWGLHQLEPAGPRRKVLILVSDGEHNVPAPALTPRQAAQLAASLHVPIYTIDTGGDLAAPGTNNGTATPGADRGPGERTLQTVARLTGGQAFRAHDTPGLLAACREIDRLERDEITSFQYRRYTEAYPWCGLAAFVFFVTAQLLEMSLWRRLP